MGRDKATIEVAGTPLLVRVAEALGNAGATSIVVAGGEAARGDAYAALLGAGARFVADDVPRAGPLGGLAAGLRVARGPALVAPVDAPALSPSAYAPLLEALPGHAAAAWASVHGSRGGIAWLFGVFDPVVALPHFERALEAGIREVAAACRSLDAVILDEARLLDIPGGARHFDNWNVPGDLARDP